MVSGVRRVNEVNARRARLVLGWTTLFGRVNPLGMEKTNSIGHLASLAPPPPGVA